jgi:hypothetical protein
VTNLAPNMTVSAARTKSIMLNNEIAQRPPKPGPANGQTIRGGPSRSARRPPSKCLAVKSFERAFEIQQNYARAAYEDYAGEMTKIGQIWRTCAEDASRPFAHRIAETSANVAGSTAKLVHAPVQGDPVAA